MSYARLEALGGIQWPCPDEEHPGAPFLHGRLWAEPVEGPPAPFSVTQWRCRSTSSTTTSRSG